MGYCICRFLCVFFFKQKTAYEMRISDWSSDVCSSDLAGDQGRGSRSDREGGAAAAGRGVVGVLDMEGGAGEVLDEVDLGAGQQAELGLVDHGGDAVSLEGAVVRVHRVIEGAEVLTSGAAAAGDVAATQHKRAAHITMAK